MQYICDFHIHSKYARATSKDMDLKNIDKWAKIKGINVIGTGDFTHPLWFKELKQNLKPAESALFKFSKSNTKVRFILTVEISTIYSKNNKTRKIHTIIVAPDFKTVEKINNYLGKIGNLKSDGRPILGLDAKELAKIVLNISDKCLIIPAHIWTPWFSLLGSKSGFDSIEECFEEYSKYIYAIETGLSSDPLMNWRLSALDNITLLSNSDAHSPAKLGREANVFEGEKINYTLIREAIINGHVIQQDNDLKLIKTLEFFPEEGKYYFDGHRKCKICFSPEESKKHKNICPKCNKPLTIGVMNRVCELADRPKNSKRKNFIPFKSLVPLKEIIADTLKMGVKTKKVDFYYKNLIKNLGSEFEVLLNAKYQNIINASSREIARGITRARKGQVDIKPGYDGEFGKISISKKQKPLL